MKRENFFLIILLSLFTLISGVLNAQNLPVIENNNTIIRKANNEESKKEFEVRKIPIESSIVNLNEYKNQLYKNRIEKYPILLMSEQDYVFYTHILVKYKEIKKDNLVYQVFFTVLIKEKEGFIITKPDLTLDYNYVEEDSFLVNDLSKRDFDFQLDNDIYPTSFKYKDFTNLVKKSDFYLSLGMELGLGGFGEEYYDLIYQDEGIDNSISYDYQYRNGHISLSTNIYYKNIEFHFGLFNELRQSRNGIMIRKTLSTNFVDDGVAKIFPKSRLYTSYGLGYVFDISENTSLIPFFRYSNYKFTGYAADEFNNLKKDRFQLITGLNLKINTADAGNFYLSIFYNRDFFSSSNVEFKAADGNIYPYRLNKHKHFQINFSFGYAVDIKI